MKKFSVTGKKLEKTLVAMDILWDIDYVGESDSPVYLPKNLLIPKEIADLQDEDKINEYLYDLAEVNFVDYRLVEIELEV